MLRIIKITIFIVFTLALLVTALVYGVLSISLPSLSGNTVSSVVSHTTSLERDELGSAIISGENRLDVAYALGYAHGQDRFFQMDLLRRNSAGELSELFGKAAVPIDKRMRFHQFRKRSQAILKTLPTHHSDMLTTYAQGVNDAVAHIQYPSFEYILTGAEIKPWQPEDSFLVIFSMYLDLQTTSFNRDLLLTQIEKEFGENMVQFLIQPSQYQAALDGSEFELLDMPLPKLRPETLAQTMPLAIEEPLDIGSNNWAVTGALTKAGGAMLSDDMHLGLAVPIIWYRAQLKYGETQVTGVTLPGVPAVVVGSNGQIAWGFTNGYIDTADWVRLTNENKTTTVVEKIVTPEGDVDYPLELSEFGPVKLVDGEKYALSWVAHQPYAVDMELLGFEQAQNVEQALQVAKTVGIPVQNMMVVDKDGNAAWQATGAIPGRTTPYDTAISAAQFDNAWQQDATDVPFIANPDLGRLWTGNSRVVSVEQAKRYGNGGYALGARSEQIKQRLFEKTHFDEADFYDIQLDNEALFLVPWQQLLLKVLNSDPDKFAQDIKAVEQWQQCACADSVGYTLVRKYRSALIDAVFAPIESAMHMHGLTLKPIKRDLETGVWQIINTFPDDWLTADYASWPDLMRVTYIQMRDDLLVQHTGHKTSPLSALTWGEVNALQIKHPFSQQIPQLSKLLDMPKHAAFGDSFMPAVQGTGFGASQRLIVKPGDEKNAILTLPGGQSGHPLSPFYRSGYADYVNHKNTPLLPGKAMHKIEFSPN